jgi:hypothetical protein
MKIIKIIDVLICNYLQLTSLSEFGSAKMGDQNH